jgi:hypothetical protein
VRGVTEDRPARVLSSLSVERGWHVVQASRRMWFRLALVLVGLFGAAFAISGLLIALPNPAVGGTCGPPNSSEAAIVALLDPGSIGAGPEPPATSTTRTGWLAFVGECQASADSRGLGSLIILVLSIGVALTGTTLLLRLRRPPARSTPPSLLVGPPAPAPPVLPQ